MKATAGCLMKQILFLTLLCAALMATASAWATDGEGVVGVWNSEKKTPE